MIILQQWESVWIWDKYLVSNSEQMHFSTPSFLRRRKRRMSSKKETFVDGSLS
jgi:hypothetical protein